MSHNNTATTADAWSLADWINRGSEQIASQPALGQWLISQGLKQEPGLGVAWFNLGLALHQQRRIAAAIRAYRLALRCTDAPIQEATTNLAQDLLLSGAFVEGWRLYEQRLQSPKARSFAPFLQNYGEPWRGFDDPRPCSDLVVVAEQGFGDTLQFCRLMPLLQQRGLRTQLFCQDALAPLLRHGSSIGEISLVLGLGGPGVRWCPLLSLPQRLELNHRNIPSADGYLHPCADRVRHWGKRLQRAPGKRLIGLHWQGNPQFERKLYSRGRSMPFEAWLGLRTVQNVEFLCLQKGDARQQCQHDAGLPFVAGQAEFDASFDFQDTAAALAHCDLLLSADSSVVHLGGAMGVPTWVALSWVPEWRWGLEGSHTPWYASARLFRQPRAGDWEAVVASMATALQGMGP